MFRLGFSNVHNDARAVQSLKSLDYAVLNESRGSAVGVRPAGFSRWTPVGPAGINPHIWSADKFHVIPLGSRMLCRGGRRGLADTNASRARKRRFKGKRLGPNRYATSALVTENATGKSVIIVGAHFPARTQTVEAWRWPVMVKCIRSLRVYVRDLQAEHPGVPVIFGGDTNLRTGLVIGKGWITVKTLADLGRNHYTKVIKHGHVTVKSVGEIRNASDHDTPVVSVTL